MMTSNNISMTPNGKFTLKHRLQLGHWNLNGLMSKQFGSKLDNEDVLKVIESCHIFGITETHLLPSNGKQLIGYRDFHLFRKKVFRLYMVKRRIICGSN